MPLERIERLTASQRDDLYRLYRNEWWTADREPSHIEAVLDGSDVVVGFADAETGDLVAFARAITDGVYKALVFDVIVAPDRRRTGLGDRLLGALFDHPTLSDVEHVELYCREELAPFSEQCDFSAELGDLVFMRRARETANGGN